MTPVGYQYVPPIVLKALEKSDDAGVAKAARAAAAPIKKARDSRAKQFVSLTEAQATAQLTSAAPSPTSRRKSIVTKRHSASASTSSTPTMSMFHWKNSRRRPRCGRSARQTRGIENHLIGRGRALIF